MNFFLLDRARCGLADPAACGCA